MQMMAQQDPQLTTATKDFSRHRSKKICVVAELTADFAKKEKEITSQFDADPLLKLKSREVDLRAMENQRKKDADQANLILIERN